MNCFKIIHGDCLIEMAKMPDKLIDIVITSPPYNLSVKYNEYNDNRTDYLSWMSSIFKEIKRILKDNGSFFINIGYSCKNPYIDIDIVNISREYFILQNRINWIKSIYIDKTYGHFKPINSDRYLNQCHESIFHFTKNGDVKINKLSLGVPYEYESNIKRWSTGEKLRCRGNNWFIKYKTIHSKEQKGKHPAIFPLELPINCMKLHGNGLVLDPFMGTGTTLAAAKQLGLDAIGIEIDQFYIDYAKNLLDQSN